VPDKGAIAVDFSVGDARFSLILARRGADVFAYENVCAHASYPLDRHDGRVVVQEGGFIICAMHFASFALDTGACAGGPCNGAGLKQIAVRVVDGAILMDE
jgi:nitrite reductase/ring-hydroxylating ferredoxin subunit